MNRNDIEHAVKTGITDALRQRDRADAREERARAKEADVGMSTEDAILLYSVYASVVSLLMIGVTHNWSVGFFIATIVISAVVLFRLMLSLPTVFAYISFVLNTYGFILLTNYIVEFDKIISTWHQVLLVPVFMVIYLPMLLWACKERAKPFPYL